MGNLGLCDFVAPRSNPLIHPGKRPPSSYIVGVDNTIFLMKDIVNGIKQAYLETSEGQLSVNDFLENHHVARLEERIPLIAYGTNPCPGQLVYKFRPIDNQIVPVIKGCIKGWDIVYKFISNPGYAYAHLIPSKDVTVEAWITLLDQEQYERMNWTEGVLKKSPDYQVGIFPDLLMEGSIQLQALVYIGNSRPFVSPQCGNHKNTPVAIAEIPAEGRKMPALCQEDMLNHGLDVLKLHDFLRSYKDDLQQFPGSSGKKLAFFLNKHFNLHNGGEFQCNRCAELLARISELAESQQCQEVAVSEISAISRAFLTRPNRSPFRFGDVLS